MTTLGLSMAGLNMYEPYSIQLPRHYPTSGLICAYNPDTTHSRRECGELVTVQLLQLSR